MGTPRATVVLVHGLGEHIARYDDVAAFLTGQGFAVRGFDLRGHGHSLGPRAFVRSFREHLDDLQLYFNQLRADGPGTPTFVFGHSMGGCIVLLFAVTRRPDIQGLVLSAPSVLHSGAGALTRAFTPIARLLPSLGTRALDPADLSHDPSIVSTYRDDPLAFHGRVPVATIAALGRASSYVLDRLDRLTVPSLYLQGDADRIVPHGAANLLFRRTAAVDRVLKTYPDLYHEILNEPQRDEVLADILAWLNGHTR